MLRSKQAAMQHGESSANEAAAKQKHARKRIAIAAEALTNAADVTVPNVPKSEKVQILIGAVHPSGPRPLFRSRNPSTRLPSRLPSCCFDQLPTHPGLAPAGFDCL
jgi:hypothetical protein